MRRGQVLRRPARGSIVVLVGLLACAPAPAATPTFTAQGSAEQVYVTGLPADATMSLLSSSGATIATQSSDSLGGLLFRNVAPGNGYRVQLSSTGEKSAPITVHSDAAAPWDPSIYNQTISDNGYQYLTTRDGTKLAIDVHPRTARLASPGLHRCSRFRPSRVLVSPARRIRHRTRR